VAQLKAATAQNAQGGGAQINKRSTRANADK
jgi:hypothetical protein